MKKIFTFTLVAAITLGAAFSCSKEIDNPGKESVPEDENVTPQEPIDLVTWTFTAAVENPVTKVGPMDESGNFAWEDNDEVTVLYAGGSTTCNASVSGGAATFSPSVPEDITTLYLVYPSSATASLDGDKLVVGMPDAQKDALAGYFVAKADKGDETVPFIHPVCYYKFVVDGDGTDVTRLELTSAANTSITATSIAVDFSGSDVTAAASAGGASSITYDFTGAGTYYLPVVPTGTAEDDLTFQFYRGENKDEKAGGIQYGAALDNARASIVNWASLPAMATNRYVSTSATGSDNGATSGKPWSFEQFSTFWRATSNSALYDGINIRFADGTYDFSSNLNRNDTEVLHLIGESRENTIFKGGAFQHFYANGKKFTLKNITFSGSTRSNGSGGVLHLNGCTVDVENCAFTDNNITGSSNNGGVLNIVGASHVSFTDCTFAGNSAEGMGGVLTTDNANGANISFSGCTFGDGTSGNSASQGGVALLNTTGTVLFEDCTFNGNICTADGGALYIATRKATVEIKGCKFVGNTSTANGGAISNIVGSSVHIQNTVFANNAAAKGAALYDNGNGTYYMNACAFYGNHITSTYGLVICVNSTAKNAQLFLNNCTIADNHYTASGSGAQSCWINLKGTSKFVLSNSSLIGVTRNGSGVVKTSAPVLLRFDGNVGENNTLINNIIVPTSDNTANHSIAPGSSTVKGWYNKINTLGATVANYSGNSDATGYNASNFGSLAYSSDLVNYEWDKFYWGWKGTITGGSDNSMYSLIDINNAIKTADSGFYDWLGSIGALTTDGRGKTRGESSWPGAYDGTSD